MSTDGLFAAIDAHFTTADALKRPAIIARSGRGTAEGWFKAEMMCLLESLSGTVDSWRADVPLTKDNPQRCDFRIVIGGQPLWLEVKVLIDPLREAELGVVSRGGFTDDLVKLMRVHEGDKAVLLFVLPKPRPEQWAELMASYRRRIAPIGFEELTDIGAYPGELYVCKLALKEAF